MQVEKEMGLSQRSIADGIGYLVIASTGRDVILDLHERCYFTHPGGTPNTISCRTCPVVTQ